MSPHKQVVVLDRSLGLSDGKMIAQACHASLGAYEKSQTDVAEEWQSSGARKIALDSGDRDLGNLEREASNAGLPVHLVRDAGLTEVEPGTVTALGIGPAEESKIDSITGELDTIK